jgi:hypothetical protein
MAKYNTKSYVMQWVLSTHVDNFEKLQRHNLFQIFFVVNDCHVRTIIDGRSCDNLLSADFVTKMASRHMLTPIHTTFSGSTTLVWPR